jgi:arylformamidase
MRVHDISVALSENTPTYPGDPGIEIEQWKSLAKGDSASVSFVHFGAHSGTHVDAPAHFIRGAAKLDSLPLEVLIGPAQLVEVPPDCMIIDRSLVTAKVNPGTERVLFKTRNSAFWGDHAAGFQTDFTHLDLPAAELLVDLGIRLVGIDYLSIERFKSPDHAVHLCLLSKGIVILEGLNLASVRAGNYELICLPLKLAGGEGDGAPARAVLRELNSYER